MLNRRDLLRIGGAATIGLALEPALARAQALEGLVGVPEGFLGRGLQPELVTVTDRGFAAWWPTKQPSDTSLRIVGGGRERELTLERSQSVHVAALDDLEPGTTYRYELRSGGRALAASDANPGRFTTLAPPPGKLLATIGVMNDMHVGEGCSGTITSLGGESIPPCFSENDYAFRMTRAAVHQLRAREDVDLVIANGDLTDRGRPGTIRRALRLLGQLDVPVGITRGNHDRRFHETDQCADDGDCLRALAFPDNPPGDHALTWTKRVGKGVGVVGLDSCDPESGEGRLDLGGQIAYLDRQLTRLGREGRIAIVCFHHHITSQANTTHPPPIVFGVRPGMGAEQTLKVLARHDHVRLVLHGHTHRNYVSYDPDCGRRLPFLENGATKEYPAGYGLIRVYEGGIMRTFHRMGSKFARHWVRQSAQQIYGLQPIYTRGTLTSRAFVSRFACPDGGPGPSLIGPLGLGGRDCS